MALDQRMWGSNVVLEFGSTPTGGPDTNLGEQQLADVPLPESCVASVYFQADVISPPGIAVIVTSLTLTLDQGLGRVSVRRPFTWAGVPGNNVPLFFTIPFLPCKMLLATIQARGHGVGGTAPAQVRCTLEVAPISRFPMTEPLKFGMAKAGEADGLDDELLDDLEEHSPDEAAIMRHAQDNGHAPEEVELEHEGPSPEALAEMLPPRVKRIAARLARRLKRPPRMSELPAWAQRDLQQHLRGHRS